MRKHCSMKNYRERKVGVLSLVVILISYLVFRYPLFRLHGMKDFPLLLCVVGAALILITGVIRGDKVLPLMIALGYIVGFVMGVLFGYDYGEGLNNLWIIWSWCFVAVSLAGIVGNLILRKRKR